jgi:hypothetical protein
MTSNRFEPWRTRFIRNWQTQTSERYQVRRTTRATGGKRGIRYGREILRWLLQALVSLQKCQTPALGGWQGRREKASDCFPIALLAWLSWERLSREVSCGNGRKIASLSPGLPLSERKSCPHYAFEVDDYMRYRVSCIM